MKKVDRKLDIAVEVWSLFNQLEVRIQQIKIIPIDSRIVNAKTRLQESRMWLEQLEADEW